MGLKYSFIAVALTVLLLGAVAGAEIYWYGFSGVVDPYDLSPSGYILRDPNTWDFGDEVGISGQFIVMPGTYVNTTSLEMLSASGGTQVTLNGPDSIWVNSSYISMNVNSDTSMHILSGAVLEDYCASFGGSSSSHTASVVVQGEDSSWIHHGDMYLGDNIDYLNHETYFASLEICDGGIVIDQDGYVGGWSSVFVTGEGSGWINHGSLTVYDVSSNSDYKTIIVSNGGYLECQDCNMDSLDSTIEIDGSDSVWNIYGLLIAESGSIRISNGGSVRVGRVVHAAGWIEFFEGGMLAISDPDDYASGSIQAFIGMTTENIFFDSQNIADVSPDEYSLQHHSEGELAGYTVLSVGKSNVNSGNPVAGDADLDGDVDMYDFQILRSNYGTRSGAEWADGDFDGDGDVDMYDFLNLRANYGQ